MSYVSEHRRMKPVINMARNLDVASAQPEAIYEAGSGGFQIYCTPQDNPGGDWEKIKDKMTAGTFKKPAEYLASAYWRWEDETIVGVNISTDAYALRDNLPEQYGMSAISNRPEDIDWARKKVIELFKNAGLPAPTIFIDD